MPRRKEEAEHSKRLIAAKANELFCQKGYAATSMEDIRMATGMSKGSIYYHFKSKETLFLHLIEANMQEWLNTWKALEPTLARPTDKLYRLAQHYVEDFQNPLLKAAEEFMGSRSSDPAIMEQLLTLTKSHYPIFLQLLTEGMQSGEFREDDAEDLMYILFALMSGLGVAFYDLPYEKMGPLYKKAVDVFLEGIRRPSGD
ncbi:TetR family transcriptional regulator C-terminal domain-containing protein [Paenibacillus sp. MBLB4367]|uniref:TetR family transcriptional regulator C-terminal domain-containing protein n=1 Tax=Paenibacillus sp. MBLB4367 TaxID=3384767 RepID=UPI003907F980